MRIKIYQINSDRDINKVKFAGYDSLQKLQGSTDIDSEIYKNVFYGDVDGDDLEDIYAIFNMDDLGIELCNRSILADYYSINAFLIFGTYEEKKGYLLSIDWGCPYEPYFENEAPLASIDFAALGVIIYEVKNEEFYV